MVVVLGEHYRPIFLLIQIDDICVKIPNVRAMRGGEG
jgi:hypothetical protein